tara:strand:+ start:27877 stop:28323 length:447 start_codon:yes stop_codon:yes gene_type:complete
MALDPNVWGPKYWFVLHTIAITYPHTVNDVTKKKYYEFIQNLPLFLPNEEIGNTFSLLLDKYPVTPYLDSRTSFSKWMHFIHNKINSKLNKHEISMEKSMQHYYDNYKPKALSSIEDKMRREKLIFISFIVGSLFIATLLYKKGNHKI